MKHLRKILPAAIMVAAFASAGRAQFVDEFDGSRIEGWFTMSGDGDAAVELVPKEGFARMQIDSTRDRHNVWWTLIKRDITSSIDLQKLSDPAYELRVEAKIRVSDAPRRVNFMINTQRTTDFHQHLREYDISDTNEWHTISMTTRDFDAKPGDTVFVQFAATDWGLGKYHVDIDYYRADVVRRDEAKDVGEPLVYHPHVDDVGTFSEHLPATHDSVVDSAYPEINFNDWAVEQREGKARILTIDGTHAAVLRWDLTKYRDAKAAGAGVVELTTFAVPLGGNYVQVMGEDLGIEFGKIRVFEILGGDPAWDQKTVSYKSLLAGKEPAEVFNSQMTIDLELTTTPGGKTYLTLPRPVMQRLIDGRTKGLILRPLGSMAASVYASENPGGNGPVLHFSTKK